MRKILILLIAVIFLAAVNVSFADNSTDVYVSNYGSDSLGNGSVDNPYQTLNYTIEVASNNSNIYLKSGTYNSTGYEIVNKSLSITGIGDVTVDGRNGNVSQNIFKVYNGSSLVLNNIRFVNGYGSLDGDLSPITNEGELHINNCNFYNFTTINGAILNKNSLTIDNVSESKLNIDWRSVFGVAGNGGFEIWIQNQIKNNPSRGEFVTNIGDCVILNSKFVATVYNNRNMNLTNCYLNDFISNRSYDMDISTVIDKSKVMSLRVSNNTLLVVNNSFVDSQHNDLWYTNATIVNSTFYNDLQYYSLHSYYCNISIKSSSFNIGVKFDYSNVNITYSAILGTLSSGVDSSVYANFNWWGDNNGPRLSQNPYSKLVCKYWIVMTLDVVDDVVSVDFVKYTNGDTVFALENLQDVNSRFVKLDIDDGQFSKSQGYLENGSFKAKVIGDNLNTMLFAKVDNQLLRFVIGDGFTNCTWYVSNDDGNDYFCDGSYENPYKTLSKAVSMAFNGNTIYVVEGVYTLAWNAELKITKELNFVGLGNSVLSRPNGRNIFIVDEKGILNIDNINFTTHTQDDYINPLIYLTGGQLNIKNSNFYDMPFVSGIISSYKSDSINLDNVTFRNFVGSAVMGNSSYICINNTEFLSEGMKYHRGCAVDVLANLDILNSKFDNIKDGFVKVDTDMYSGSILNIYIFNTTFKNNDWHDRASHLFRLDIGNSEKYIKKYAVLDSCTFYNNVNGNLVLCNVINNCSFINNKNAEASFPTGYHTSFIYASDLINNSYFYGNSFTTDNYEYHVISSPYVYNSVFIKNTAAFGALAEAQEVHNCVFINNTGLYGADDIFLYKGNLNASSNWWGSNQKPDASKVQVFYGNLTLEDWVILNLTQDKDNIVASFKLADDNRIIHELNHCLPSRIAIFTTDNGEIKPSSTALVDNYAIAELVKNTTSDFDVYVMVDNEKLSLTVYNNSTQLLIDDVTLYGNNNKYKITLINVNGYKISNQILDILVKSDNGLKQPYTLTTDENGVAYLNINYSIGIYDIEVNYYGNGYFDKTSSKAIINISSVSTSIYSHDYTFWGKNNRFYAVLSDELGRKLLNQSIVLNVYDLKGKLLTSVDVMTGTNGIAETLLSLDVGSYKVVWNYLGNEWYWSSSSYSYVTVKPINTTLTLPNTTFYGKNNDYKFTLTDIYGNKISDEIVTLKISNATDSKDFKIKIENGVGLININLLPGIYSLDATYLGDEIYGSASAHAVLDIQKIFLTLELNSYSKIPENGVFTVILKDMYGKRISGENVSLEVYDGGLYKTYDAVSDANGEANFKLDVVENIYFGIIYFDGSTWYQPSTTAATIDVNPNAGVGKVYLNGSDYVAYYGENSYYTFLFNDTNKISLEGMIIPIVISSGDFSKAFNGESDAFGNVRIQITLDPGIYKITYKYENKYYDIFDSKTNTITIYNMPTNLIASDMIVKQGDTRNFEVKLVNKNGVAISNLAVTINIDGKSYNVSTNAFGIAKLPLNLDLGYHNVECIFDNANYISSKCNATILVVDDSKTTTNIESSETYSQEGKAFNYNIVLHDTLGNPIKSSRIILNVTDIENNFIGSYETYTDSNGESIFNLNLTYGDYIAKTYYPGNDLYFESFNNNYIYVSPLENVTETILFGSDMEIINGNNQWYSVVLKTVDGDFISNASIEFVVKGNSYYSITDNMGRAYLDVPFSPGVYEVKSKFSGSNNLTMAYMTNYIRVSGELLYLYSQDIIKSFNNGTHYYVALFDVLGQPLAGKTIQFNISNETFTRITDNDGFACFEVWFDPGEYNVTATYKGEYPDELATVFNNITVLTTILSGNITKYYDGSTRISASFLNFNDEILPNTNVLFNINNVTYKVKTDGFGRALFDINLNAGNYILSILNTLTGQIGKYSVNILSTLTTSNLVKYYKGSESFKATFKDKNGNLLKNTYVKFTIKGKTYKVKTNSNGVATFKVNLKPGKYTITTINTKTGEKHSNKITVKTRIITSNKKVKANKKINFKAKILKANGKVAKKVTIKFKINKKTYKIKTNNKGIAKLNIKLKKGKYTITTTYAGLTVKNTVRCS